MLARSGPPRGRAPQSLAPRPCATWQEARAGGRGRARFLLELRPHEGRDETDLRRTLRGVKEGAGDSVGPVWKQEAPCSLKFRGSSWELQSIREPQWSRRREGRTLLCRGGECRNTFLGVLGCLRSSKDPPRAWKNPFPLSPRDLQVEAFWKMGGRLLGRLKG